MRTPPATPLPIPSIDRPASSSLLPETGHAPGTARRRALARRPGGPLRILVADADPELRGLLALALRDDGHEVREAADGSRLLEAIAPLVIDDERPFDLLVAAQALPGLPGVSVLAGLRSRGRRVPFVLMTGNPVVQAQATRLGAVVIDRRFDADGIRRAVRRADELAQGTL